MQGSLWSSLPLMISKNIQTTFGLVEVTQLFLYSTISSSIIVIVIDIIVIYIIITIVIVIIINALFLLFY